MEEIRVAEKRLSDYRAIIGGPAFAEILAMASKLKGKRVAHVNATGYGGGGAQPPHPPAPVPTEVGPAVHWVVPPGAEGVFPATEKKPKAPPGAHLGPKP